MSSIRQPVGDIFTLAAADDLNGDPTNTANHLDVTGASRVVVLQLNSGTAGTLGIDVIQISHDGGSNWEADSSLVDNDGDAVTDAALNAAGVEPSGAAVFTSGPHAGPTLMRCVRDDAAVDPGTSVDWTTGAPAVMAITIGK